MGFIAIIRKWEHWWQWAFSPSHSSYDNVDDLFFLFIRSLLLPGSCQIMLLSPFPPLPSPPVLCALLSSDFGCLPVGLKVSVMPFVLISGNTHTAVTKKSGANISDVGWLKFSSRLQQLNSATPNTDVPRSACSLAAARSCHLWLIFPAVLCPLPHWNCHFWKCHLLKQSDYGYNVSVPRVNDSVVHWCLKMSVLETCVLSSSLIVDWAC